MIHGSGCGYQEVRERHRPFLLQAARQARVRETTAGEDQREVDGVRLPVLALASSTAVDVLDVGTGLTALPSLLRTCGYVVTAIDNMSDYWPLGTTNRHYHVVDDDITRTRMDRKFDSICCISTLEHVEDYDAAVSNMFGLLEPGGLLMMSFPYSEASFVENVYKLPGAGYGTEASYICRSYSRAELEGWVAAHDWSIKAQEYWLVFSGEYWTFGEWLRPPVRTSANEPHQLTCLLLEKGSA